MLSFSSLIKIAVYAYLIFGVAVIANGYGNGQSSGVRTKSLNSRTQSSGSKGSGRSSTTPSILKETNHASTTNDYNKISTANARDKVKPFNPQKSEQQFSKLLLDLPHKSKGEIMNTVKSLSLDPDSYLKLIRIESQNPKRTDVLQGLLTLSNPFKLKKQILNLGQNRYEDFAPILRTLDKMQKNALLTAIVDRNKRGILEMRDNFHANDNYYYSMIRTAAQFDPEIAQILLKHKGLDRALFAEHAKTWAPNKFENPEIYSIKSH